MPTTVKANALILQQDSNGSPPCVLPVLPAVQLGRCALNLSLGAVDAGLGAEARPRGTCKTTLQGPLYSQPVRSCCLLVPAAISVH